MTLSLDQIKGQFARNRGKSLVLSALTVVMVVFIVKAVLDMHPRSASASDPSPVAAENLVKAESPTQVTETEDRIRESQRLWQTLREQRGLAPAVAFTFDPSYFSLEPSRRAALAAEAGSKTETIVDRTSSVPGVVNEEAERRNRIAAIRDQARDLVVRSTVVGSSKPIAVVNERLMSVGDHVSGFEITAIRAREVEFKKDGITVAVTMADKSRGQ